MIVNFENTKNKTYVNSARGRNDLIKDCTEDIVQEVLKIWGTSATVNDPVLGIEEDQHLSDTDILGMQIVKLFLKEA